MTLRIEMVFAGQSTTIRSIGRMRAEHLDELKAQLTGCGPQIALDLEELGLVDADVVRFFGTFQAAEALSPTIHGWVLITDLCMN